MASSFVMVVVSRSRWGAVASRERWIGLVGEKSAVCGGGKTEGRWLERARRLYEAERGERAGSEGASAMKVKDTRRGQVVW